MLFIYLFIYWLAYYYVFVSVIDCGEPKSLVNGKFEFVSGSDNKYKSVVQYQCNDPFYSLMESSKGKSV